MLRSALEYLDRLLGPEVDSDDWFDVVAGDARGVLAGLLPADWDTLARVWPERPIEWQRRLAYALYGAVGARAAPIYQQMLRSPDAELFERVAYGLRTLDDEALRSAVNDEGLARIRALAGDPDHKALAEHLLARLGATDTEPSVPAQEFD